MQLTPPIFFPSPTPSGLLHGGACALDAPHCAQHPAGLAQARGASPPALPEGGIIFTHTRKCSEAELSEPVVLMSWLGGEPSPPVGALMGLGQCHSQHNDRPASPSLPGPEVP